MARSGRVQKFASDVYDYRAAPGHHQTICVGDCRDYNSVKVFGGRGLDEFLCVLGTNDDGHSLLAFGNGKLGSVKAFVLFGNGVKVDVQAGRQLSDGYAHSARSKVVAADNHKAHVFVSEQALNLSLLDGVSLLDFGGGGGDGLFRVDFRRAGRSSDSVSASSASKQNHYVASLRRSADNVFGRSGRDHRAKLHALCRVSGMVYFVDLACGQADLVSVARKALGGFAAKL